MNKAALICPHLGPPVGSFFKILAPGKSQRLQNLSASCLSFSHNNPDNPSSGQRSGRCVFNWCEVCACEYHGLFFTKSVKVMPKGQSLGMKSSGHLNSGKRHEAEPGATVCLSKREIYTVALRFAEGEEENQRKSTELLPQETGRRLVSLVQIRKSKDFICGLWSLKCGIAICWMRFSW